MCKISKEGGADVSFGGVGRGEQLSTPACQRLSNCPPLAFVFLMHDIGENKPGVGSWKQGRRYCSLRAQAEMTLLGRAYGEAGFTLYTSLVIKIYNHSFTGNLPATH